MDKKMDDSSTSFDEASASKDLLQGISSTIDTAIARHMGRIEKMVEDKLSHYNPQQPSEGESSKRKRQPNDDRPINCHYCGKPGHIPLHCPDRRFLTCYECGELGHIRRDCPHIRNFDKNVASSTSRPPRKSGRSR